MAQAGLVTVACSCGALLNFTMVKESFPRHLVGTACGCVNMLFPVWAAILQVLFGALLGFLLIRLGTIQTAYSAAFCLVVLNMIIALVCSLLTKESFHNSQNA